MTIPSQGNMRGNGNKRTLPLKLFELVYLCLDIYNLYLA